MTGTSAAVQATSRRSAYRPHRVAGRKAEYGRFSVLPRPEIHRNLRIKDSVKIDPCMGSGHILVYAFDVLMDIYRSRGYTDRDAVQSIVTNNLYGLDIDDRAAQLAYFAVMMKACEYDRRFLRRGIQPQVCAIQESPAIDAHALDSFGPDAALAKKLYATFIDAKEYGSILHVDLTGDELRRLSHSVIAMGAATTGESIANIGDSKHAAGIITPLVKQATIMARKYDVVVTNPPYMGASGMGEKLSKFVKDNYPDSKSDLFAVFIEKGLELAKETGLTSMITMESWMFLSSFEKLRGKIIIDTTITTMVHMPYLGKGGTSLGINFGTAATVIRKQHVNAYIAAFDRIVYYETDDEGVPFSFPVENEYYKHTNTENFTKIPGMPVAYWVSDAIIDSFSTSVTVDAVSDFTGSQNITANNDQYLRNWFEVDNKKIGKNANWAFYAKGGEYRKWYGNIDLIVATTKDAISFYINNPTSNYLAAKYWYTEGITYSAVTSKGTGFRYWPPIGGFDKGGATITYVKEIEFVMALLNSKIAQLIFEFLNPTINLQVKDVKAIPIPQNMGNKEKIKKIVKDNLSISQNDWDSFETSWNFEHHPLM